MQKLSKAEVSSYKISLNLLKTIKKFNLELKTLAQFPLPPTPTPTPNPNLLFSPSSKRCCNCR